MACCFFRRRSMLAAVAVGVPFRPERDEKCIKINCLLWILNGQQKKEIYINDNCQRTIVSGRNRCNKNKLEGHFDHLCF